MEPNGAALVILGDGTERLEDAVQLTPVLHMQQSLRLSLRWDYSTWSKGHHVLVLSDSIVVDPDLEGGCLRTHVEPADTLH
jgi:hypothetical protein